MRELSLFTGAGGGVWGTKLLGWETVGYVEWDSYCQKVIRQRIEDGIFDRAPIFSDVRAFAGIAGQFKGLVDVVTAGFPCQPFSAAGKKLGENDPRNMWPATAQCIAEVRPRLALLENVPGLTSTYYFGRVIGDLTELGYDAKWTVISAAELGAPHVRKRLWILATDTNSAELREEQIKSGRSRAVEFGEYGEAQHVADAEGVTAWRLPIREKEEHALLGSGCKDVADTASIRPQGSNGIGSRSESAGSGSLCKPARDDCGIGGWWQVEPDVGRVVDGMANRRNRLRALGNGQVPAVVREAWRRLSA